MSAVIGREVMLALQDRCDGDTQVHPKFAFVYESYGRLVMRKLKNEKLFTQLGHEDEWDCPLRGDQHLSCREAIHPRHQDVAHHDIGIKTDRRLNQFVAIATSSDDLRAV